MLPSYSFEKPARSLHFAQKETLERVTVYCGVGGGGLGFRV